MNMKNASPIYDLIRDEYGLEITKTIEQEIEKAADALIDGRKALQEKFSAPLANETTALKQIISRVTVSETYFFRHAEHFSEIVEIFSRNFAQGSASSFWSAGCSSGEEAYSIAMSLVETFGWQALESASIFGSDICEESVAKARNGVYSRWSFRDMSQPRKERFFKKTEAAAGASSSFRIDERLRKAVFFENSSIQSRLRQMKENSLDVIMFRNVGIYMNREALEIVFAEMSRILKKDGLLIVAPADPRPALPDLKRTNHKSTSVYIKGAFEKDGLETQPYETRFYPVEVKLERDFSTSNFFFNSMKEEKTAAPVKTEFRVLKKEEIEDESENYAPKALALCGRGEYAKALEIADELIKKNPESVSSHILRGQIYYAEEMFDEAVESFRRAVYLSPEDPLARYWHALAQRELGLLAQSRGSFERCLDLLSQMASNSFLSDGVTTVGELLKAVEFNRTAQA